jgi:hypothetical protein
MRKGGKLIEDHQRWMTRCGRLRKTLGPRENVQPDSNMNVKVICVTRNRIGASAMPHESDLGAIARR